MSAARLRELETLHVDGPEAYERLKDRVRRLVATRVPAGRTLVVSKGDDELLALHDRRGEHFPQDALGRFPSSHPADGADAVAQLEALGGRYLVIPATSFWWLAHYEELTALLERGELVALEPDTAAVFALAAEAGASAGTVREAGPSVGTAGGTGPSAGTASEAGTAGAWPPLRAAGPAGRGRVLFFCHNHPEVRPAGAENYALELHRALAAGGPYESLFVARGGLPMGEERPAGELREIGGPGEYLLHTDVGEWDVLLGTMRDKRLYTRDVRRLLEEARPDVVHVQHTYLLGHELLREVHRTLPGVPIVHTLHELLPICHNRGQMVRTWGTELCDRASPQRCHECFPGAAPERFFLREHFIRAQLDLVDRFVCPSGFLAERFAEWGLPRERLLVEDYGRSEDAAPAAPRADPPVRVGFFGQLSAFKGVDVLLEAALALQRAGSPARFTIHGSHLDLQAPEFRARFAELLDATAPTVRMHGAYGPGDLDALMGDVDWVVVPSIWWENSPLVIQEAFQRGRPVICSDIGGMAEKVGDGVSGLHFRAGDATALAATIERAVSEPGLWDRLHAGVPRVHRMEDHVAWLTALYDEVRAERRSLAYA